MGEGEVRASFEPYFRVDRSGEYVAQPGGPHGAVGHWIIFSKRTESG